MTAGQKLLNHSRVTKKFRILLPCSLCLLQCRKPEDGFYELTMPEAAEAQQEQIINCQLYGFTTCTETAKWNPKDRSPPQMLSLSSAIPCFTLLSSHFFHMNILMIRFDSDNLFGMFAFGSACLEAFNDFCPQDCFPSL